MSGQRSSHMASEQEMEHSVPTKIGQKLTQIHSPKVTNATK